MAKKFSTNNIPDGNYSADWANDQQHLSDAANTGYPYSGEAVLKFIKDELLKKLELEAVETEVASLIGSTLFNLKESTEGDTSADEVLTSLEGNADALTYKYKVKNPDGTIVTRTKTIDISTVDVNDRFLRVTSALSNNYINVGGDEDFYYGFAVTDYEGKVIENQYATAILNLYRQGNPVAFLTINLGQVVGANAIGSTTLTVSLTSILKEYVSSSANIIATISLAYTYSYTDDEGETVQRTVNAQSSNTVTVIALTLETGVNIAAAYLSGQVSIPYTIKGNGTKAISLYKNGVLVDSVTGITSSNTSSTFTQTLGAGRTNYQMVAEASAGNTTVESSSYYFDLAVPTTGTNINFMFEDSYGEIKDSANYLTPTLKAAIYETFNMQYYVYNASSTTTPLVITTEELGSDNQVLSTSKMEQVVGRQAYTYSKRIKTSNKYKVTFAAGTSTRTFYIEPQVGSVDIELPTDGLMLNLDADGRSNEETNPAVWEYGEYSTKFEGVNWDTDGWVEEDDGSKALLLLNGAKATINFPLFAPINNTAVALNEGCTFEILLKTKNLSSDTTPIVKCLWQNNGKNIGLNITPTYLGVNTGDQRLLPSDEEDAEPLYEDVSVGQTFSEGTYYKYTFVIDKYVSKTSLYKAYINGELSYAAPINSENELINLTSVPIVIDSTAGDVYIKSIKYYKTALTHDNCVDSYIVDQDSVSKIESLYNNNLVYAQDSYGKDYVSPEKLLALGLGVMIFSPSIYQTTPEVLSDVNAITNKKAKGFVFRVDYFAPKYNLRLDGGSGTGDAKGEDFNFTHLGCDVTIQGTTSALRPRKNYRINLNKNQLSQATITVNGVEKKPYKGATGNAYIGDFMVNGDSKNSAKFKYKISDSNVASSRFALKADFVDSSMTHNTGGALMFTELTKVVEAFLNPAQIRERENDGTIKTRVSIEGFPINIFEATAVADVIKYGLAKELSDSNYSGLRYMGQYNFNNDKSKTGDLFGFDGAYTYDVGTTCTSKTATAVALTGWYLDTETGVVSLIKTGASTLVALGIIDKESYSSVVAGDTPVYDIGSWTTASTEDVTGTLIASAGEEGNIFDGVLATKAGNTVTLNTQKLFNAATTTGAYNSKGNAEAICMEFLNNTIPMNAFWVKYNADGTLADSNWEDPFKVNQCYELRAPALLTDFINADTVGDYKKCSNITGGLSMLNLSNAEIKAAQDKADTRGDGNIEDYRWVKGCIQRLFTFVGTCAKEVAVKNGVTIAELNNLVETEDVKSTTAFDSWDWTNDTFANNATEYFNMDNVCMWYLWTDYMLAVDQRNKNMMIYTMDGLHWMFQYYDGDTVLGESNDCALAYDYLTTRDTFDNSRAQFAFQGHSNWLWYLVRANFSSLLKSTCDTMRKSSRFSPQYIKEVFNNQIVGSWNQRLINQSEQYRYIDQLSDTKTPDGTTISTSNEAYLNTVQGSRLAHRNYMIENRFAMLDAEYQTQTWLEDATTCNITGTVNIKSAIPYTFGFGRSSRGIDDAKSTNKDNSYAVSLNVTGGSANEPIILYGLAKATEIKMTGALQSENTANPANFSSSVLAKLDMSGVTNGTYIGLSGTSSLAYLYIQNSSIATVSGLLDCKKLKEFNALNSNFTSFLVADGCQIESIKLNKPTSIVLSNLSNIKYSGATDDNLEVTSWGSVERLVLNGCDGVDLDYILEKFASSTATQKAIRIQNLNKTISSITWLDQFEGMYGLTRNSLGSYSLDTSGPALTGTVTLSDYTDDDTVEEYRAKFPNLTINQPEFTMIRAAELATSHGANIVNVDNNTGYGTGADYVPSGHILNILNRVHRYLGKVTLQGTRIELEGNPNDTDTWGQKFYGRDTDGQMTLIQLADADSNYYATGYSQLSTRKLADLSGAESKGEVGVLIPGFWYKGVNYHTPQQSAYKYNFTCYSSLTDRPSTSSDVKVLSIASLKELEATSANTNDGVYATGYFVYASTADNYATLQSRLSKSSHCDVYRVKVEGYKKIQYPVSINCACVFTDADGKVITSTKDDGTTGIVNGKGQLLVGSSNFTLNGMPMISTIPSGAVYFFLSIKTDTNTTTTGTNTITPEYCDIVLHKGSKFTDGDAMTLENAKEWLADMEPNWVYSDPVFIHAAECVAYNNGLGNSLYTPFNGKLTGTRGSGNTAQYLDPGISQEYCQYYFRYLAEQRGLQLIDYEASKLIAMLFYAKYGIKDSQELLGGGTSSNGRLLGVTASIGMQDTICKNLSTGAYLGSAVSDSVVYNAYSYSQSANGTVTYSAIGSPNFLGIENVQGNLYEWMDKVYYANETAANCGKLRITMPNGTTRRVLSTVPSGNYPISTVHGRYCDIASCGISAGSTTTGYCDYQLVDTALRSTWISTHAVGRSFSVAVALGGVFCLYGSYSVAYPYTSGGSRLIFRGNFDIVSSIQTFEDAPEDRSLAGD